MELLALLLQTLTALPSFGTDAKLLSDYENTDLVADIDF
jgi:hypothetical protein